MSNQPDIVLMDVNLEGSREGIEVAKKLREACEARIVFVTGYTDPDTVKRIRKEVLERHFCRSRSGVTALPMPLKR